MLSRLSNTVRFSTDRFSSWLTAPYMQFNASTRSNWGGRNVCVVMSHFNLPHSHNCRQQRRIRYRKRFDTHKWRHPTGWFQLQCIRNYTADNSTKLYFAHWRKRVVKKHLHKKEKNYHQNHHTSLRIEIAWFYFFPRALFDLHDFIIIQKTWLLEDASSGIMFDLGYLFHGDLWIKQIEFGWVIRRGDLLYKRVFHLDRLGVRVESQNQLGMGIYAACFNILNRTGGWGMTVNLAWVIE